jgi:hypothetical protein
MVTLNQKPTLERSFDRIAWELIHRTTERSYVLSVMNDGAGQPDFSFGFWSEGEFTALVTMDEWNARAKAIADHADHTLCPMCAARQGTDLDPAATFVAGDDTDCVICDELTLRAAEAVVRDDRLYAVMTPTEADIRAELIRYWSALTLIVGVML